MRMLPVPTMALTVPIACWKEVAPVMLVLQAAASAEATSSRSAPPTAAPSEAIFSALMAWTSDMPTI